MTDPILSPYGFVPLDGKVVRSPFPGWGALQKDHVGGVLVCELEALTPLFTADHQREEEVSPGSERKKYPFLQDEQGKYLLQGTSLKGMIRSIFEAAHPSCLLLVAASGEGWSLTVPEDYRHSRCNDVEALCPACRLFGFIGGERHAQGRVVFSDAVLMSEAQPSGFFSAELFSPRPNAYARYSKTGRAGGEIRGRKLYYHHEPAFQEGCAPAGSRFAFTVGFHNLTRDELTQLVDCLVLDSRHAHKLGMAKPLGFGSCRIRVLPESRCWTGAGRYGSWEGAEAGEEVPVREWKPTPAALDELLEWPNRREGRVSYQRPRPPRGGGPRKPVERQVPPQPLAKLDFASLPLARNPGKDKPAKTFKKGDKANIRVLRVEEPGRRYILECKESGQDDIVFEAGVSWQEGQRWVVRVVDVKDGRIKSVKWP